MDELRPGAVAAVLLCALAGAKPAYAATLGGNGYDHGRVDRGAVVSTSRPGFGEWFVLAGWGFKTGTKVSVTASRGGLTCWPSGCRASVFDRGKFYLLVKLPKAGLAVLTAVGMDARGGSRAVGARVTVRDRRVAPAPYSRALLADGAILLWRVGERTGATATDTVPGGMGATFGSGVTLGAPGAIASEPEDTAISLHGTNDGGVIGRARFPNPQPFSLELWFKTTTTTGGRLAGFGDAASGTSVRYDRHVYLNDGGQLLFGAWTGSWSGSAHVVKSERSYTDGRWHQVVATLGTDGMVLYVDGAEVGRGPNTGAQDYDGYWRLGGDDLAGWPEAPTTSTLRGGLDDFAVFPTQLSAAQVARHSALAKG